MRSHKISRSGKVRAAGTTNRVPLESQSGSTEDRVPESPGLGDRAGESTGTRVCCSTECSQVSMKSV